MEFSFHIHSIILEFVLFFLLFSQVFPTKNIQKNNQTFEPKNESTKMKLIKAHDLIQINKPFVKSIPSPDGDIIDCVLIHLQPAFDHPKLKGTMPADPPEIPYGKKTIKESVLKQLWSLQGESCPNGTIPIKRSTTSEDDIFKPIPISKFGKIVNADSTHAHQEQEHAIGYVKGEYYGAQATLNLWRPSVAHKNEFSSSQIWVTSDFPNHDFNTIQAGWTVSPGLYKDNSSRLFIYWTNDGYRSGCFDLLCPGFVQTNRKVALGTALHPVSRFDGEQYSMDLLIWKDLKNGNWWLKVGDDLMGYWPAKLFPNLQDHATLLEFGGLVFNSQESGKHTSTQMGSGRFTFGGFREAAYIKNVEVVDEENYKVNPVSGLQVLADRPSCYDVRSGFAEEWQNFIYFGGPGRNPNCP